MSRRRLTYRPFVPALAPGSDEQRIVDLPRRRREGYGLAPESGLPPKAEPVEKTAAYHQALFGDDRHWQDVKLPNQDVMKFSTDGCLAETRAKLYGTDLLWARVQSIPQVLDNRLRAGTRSAPALAQANLRWRACMSRAGYRSADSDAVVRDLAAAYEKHPRPAGLHRREVRAAVADGECALQAHLPGIELSLRRARAQTLPVPQRAELTELATAECRAYGQAARILAKPAAPC